ncbi:hypothetical protein GQR58_015736 [Nymphon striatum]|nr:hypothetical protein GQR58_015736 [Nymphon striatum]
MACRFPPSYSAATHQHSSLFPGIASKDFIPNSTEPAGISTKPLFEPFGILMKRANEFLKKNHRVQVKTCESVEFKLDSDGTPRIQKMTYSECDSQTITYLRGLRLWLVPRDDPSHPPQQLGYFNTMPNIVSLNIGTPDFEPLDTVIDRINKKLRIQPIEGRILNVETQEMKYKGYSKHGMDPDRSCWKEYTNAELLFVYILRVFYEVEDPSYEIIGCADFLPECKDNGGIFADPTYEPFSQVIKKASAWCYHNSRTRFCNAQTMCYKLKSGGVNTKRMHFVEHGQTSTCFVKILRVVYATPFVPMEVAPPFLIMNSKTFEPVALSTGGIISTPKYESLDQTKKRISAWIAATGARVLSVETRDERMNAMEKSEGPNSSYTINTGRSCSHKMVFRVYFDGNYQELPPEVLPPLPTLEDDSCCNII